MSLFHCVTTPTTFEMVTKQGTSYKDGAALAVFSMEGVNPSWSRSQSGPPSCYRAQPEQLCPPRDQQQFTAVPRGWLRRARLDQSHTIRVQASSVGHSTLRKAAGGSSSTSPRVVCVLPWLAKTVRKTRSFKLQLCHKSQIRKGHSVLHSYFQSTSEVKW